MLWMVPTEPMREVMSPRWRFSKKIHGQAEQVRQDVAIPLQAETCRQVDARPGAHQPDGGLQYQEKRECNDQDGQEIGIRTDQDMVDDALGKQRRHQGEDLQGKRQDQDLDQRALQSSDGACQLAERNGWLRLLLFELKSGAELKSDAGEPAGTLIQRHFPQSKGGIHDRQPFALDLRQHHEMIEIPMQDARQLQLVNFRQLQPQWTREKTVSARDADKLLKCGSLQREAILAAEGGEIHVATMMGEDHRQAGKSALGRFRLNDRSHARLWDAGKIRMPGLSMGRMLEGMNCLGCA